MTPDYAKPFHIVPCDRRASVQTGMFGGKEALSAEAAAWTATPSGDPRRYDRRGAAQGRTADQGEGRHRCSSE